MKFLKDIQTKLKKELKKDPRMYALSFAILAGAFYFRVYRLDQLIGFYFDQGRDALVIWDFWKNKEAFLIGPTTGIAGIFRGPFYYWLITPFYVLGGGNPVWPSVFLSATAVAAIAIAMYLAKELEGWRSAIIVGILSGFSYYLIQASRWLSNPTPMLLVSMCLVFSIFQIMRGLKWYWAAVGLLLGLAMQFGSATEVFYYVVVAAFAIWQRRTIWPSPKILLVSAGLLFLTFAPQILFDYRNNGILSNNIKKFLFEDESFRVGFWEMVKVRFPFYKSVFFSKLFPTDHTPWKYTLGLCILALGLNWKAFFKDKRFIFVLALTLAPIIGMLFFQGNQGNVYDYYFTGYYMVFMLLVSVLLGTLSKRFWGLILVGALLAIFWSQNFNLTRNYVSAGADGPSHITLGNQLQAVDWVINDAKKQGKEFNVDVYVPPVIPYAYDYLFLWQTTLKCGVERCGQILDQQVPLLYTVYEVDDPHPERLEAWFARQAGIGVVQEEIKFGGVTAQRRLRLPVVEKKENEKN